MMKNNTEMWKRKKKEEFVRQGKWFAPHYRESETYVDESGGISLLRFRCCDHQDWMELAFSTRQGGVSKGDLTSLNLGWDRGEPRENVIENYKRVCDVLGVDFRHVVLSDQIHETKIVYADRQLWGGENMEKKVSGVDGLYTDIPDVILATSYADCVPLFFYAPGRHMIASVHSGWRGTVSKIGQKTVTILREHGC
jgi:hypothetical protein